MRAGAVGPGRGDYGAGPSPGAEHRTQPETAGASLEVVWKNRAHQGRSITATARESPKGAPT